MKAVIFSWMVCLTLSTLLNIESKDFKRWKSIETNPYEGLKLNEYLDIQLVCMSVPTGIRRCLNGKGSKTSTKRVGLLQEGEFTFDRGGVPYYGIYKHMYIHVHVYVFIFFQYLSIYLSFYPSTRIQLKK